MNESAPLIARLRRIAAVGRLTSTVWGSFAGRLEEERLEETGFDIANPEIARLRGFVDRLLEFPRHLSQHVGGFVLTQGRLDEMVPIHNAAMAERTCPVITPAASIPATSASSRSHATSIDQAPTGSSNVYPTAFWIAMVES